MRLENASPLSFMSITIQENEWLSSHKWDRNIPCPVPRKKMKEWQEKINEVFGFIKAGYPVVRVVWGQDRSTFRFNRLTKTMIPKYDWAYNRREILDKKTGLIHRDVTWIGLPRLILERAYEPRRAAQIQTAETINKEGQIVAPEVVDEVEYYRFDDIGILLQHDSIKIDGEGACCRRVRDEQLSTRCYGHFREFDEEDLYALKGYFETSSRVMAAAAAGIHLIGA